VTNHESTNGAAVWMFLATTEVGNGHEGTAGAEGGMERSGQEQHPGEGDEGTSENEGGGEH
jgi:hypothetical protein